MTRLTRLLLLAALPLLAGALPALAAAPTPAPVGKPAHSTSIAHMAAGAEVAAYAYKDVLAKLADPAAPGVIAGFTAATPVKFIELHQLKGYPGTAKFTAAEATSLKALRDAAAKNKDFAAALRRAGFLRDDLVIAIPDAAGTVFVFINL